MRLIKYFTIILVIFSTFSLSAGELTLSVDEEAGGGYVNLGTCKIHLKNTNTLTGKVRIRFNYDIYGKNFEKGSFAIQDGYNIKKVLLADVKELRLAFIHWPFKGKIMIKTKNGKEYPLKYYIVSREPVQIITKKRDVLNLDFSKFTFIERL
jgi:hypothetical protein